MKGGVVIKLRLIVFLPSILVLWDDKGTLAVSVPQMHDNSQFPKFLVLDKPGGKKSLIEIEGKTGRKESVQKQTEEPTDALRQIEIDHDCYDCFGYQICCNFGNGTRRCEYPKNCPTYGKENGIKNHDYSGEKCIFRGKEYMPGETRKCGCTKCTCMDRGGWKEPLLGCIEPVRDETVKATTQETMITPPHEMKNEGETCGNPPHGVICHLALSGTRLKSFGLCKEGLHCQTLNKGCGPGKCRKAEKGLLKNNCPEFNPPGCNGGNGCKDGEVCCTCAPCRRGDMCFKTSCPSGREVPEKCYKNTTQDSGIKEFEMASNNIEGSGHGIDLSEPPKNSEIGFSCCKEKGVSDECIGYCGKAGAIGQRLGKQTGKCEKWFEAIIKCREGGGSSGPTTEEPEDDCTDCVMARKACCEYGNGTRRCEYPSNCPTYGKDYSMTSHKSRTPDCSMSMCGLLDSPVCGSDGKTYSNECFLEKIAACEDGKQDLVIASKGPCSGARMMNG